MVAPIPISLLVAWLLWLAFRAAKSEPPENREDWRAPFDPRLARIARIRQLVESNQLDAAVTEGRAWLRDDGAGSDLSDPAVLRCLAEVVWAHLIGLPETADRATSFGEELLARIRSMPATDPWTRLHTVLALARTAEAVNDTTRAKEGFLEAVAIAGTIENFGRPDLVVLLLGLAAACQDGGCHDEALDHLERALGIQDSLPNRGRPLLEILARTGWSLFAQGELERARAVLERAVAVGQESCTEREYARSGAGECLGRVLVARGELAAAVARLTETADLEGRVFGSNSPAQVSTLFVLADALAQMGSFPEAVHCLERARAIPIHPGASGHVTGHELTLTLAKLKFAQGLVAESRLLLAEELDAEQRRAGVLDSRLLAILAGLAGTCRALHDAAGEREALERAMGIVEKTHGAQAAELMPMLVRLGQLIWDAGDWSGARDLNRRLAEIQREHLVPEHPDIALTLLNLGVTTARLGEYSAATQSFSSAMDILAETPLPPREILERTVEILEELQAHTLHGTRYRDLLPRARALKRAADAAAPIARA